MIKGGAFFVMNGDVITDIDIKKMKRACSVAAIPMRTKFGMMRTDGETITDFVEKKEIPEVLMNAGIYYLSRDALADLPRKGDIEKTLFPSYARDRRLFHVRFDGAVWHSIDSHKDIEECAADMHKIIK